MENEIIKDVNAEQPAPVVEKVSISEIKEEQQNENFEKIGAILQEYLSLTPEEKAFFKKELLK